MRKTVAILFSLLLVCSLSLVALADAAEDPVLEPEVVIQTAEDPVLEPEEVMQTEISDPAVTCDHEHGLESESLPVLPATMTFVEEVAPTSLLAEPCDACDEGTVRKTRVERGTWVTYDQEFCSHNDYTGPVDFLQKREVVDIYECDRCFRGYKVFVGYDYAVYCQQRSHRYITTQL